MICAIQITIKYYKLKWIDKTRNLLRTKLLDLFREYIDHGLSEDHTSVKFNQNNTMNFSKRLMLTGLLLQYSDDFNTIS